MGKTKEKMTELERAEYDHVEIAHVIAERLEELVGRIGAPREFMRAEEAAEFIGMSYNEFRKIAPTLPRYAISERRFVYWRPELVEWVLCNREANANEQKPTATYKSHNPGVSASDTRLRYGR